MGNLRHTEIESRIVNEVRRMIEDEEYRSTMLAGYQDIRDALGGEGASAAVAKAMIEELSM